jgi:four helix bundle protein
MRDYHDLKVWAKAHQLALSIYKVSAGFPQREIYALTSQLRRAAISVASNIAEGCGRYSEAEFAHFLQIAMGSASELQYELLLARDLSFLSESEFQPLDNDVVEVKKMLVALIQKLNAKS